MSKRRVKAKRRGLGMRGMSREDVPLASVLARFGATEDGIVSGRCRYCGKWTSWQVVLDLQRALPRALPIVFAYALDCRCAVVREQRL